MNIKKTILGASCANIALTSLALTSLTVTTPAYAGDVNWSLGTDLVSEYVFRGASLGTESVQPFVEVSTGNFTAGAWFSTQVGSSSELSADEVDLYASYSVPLDGPITVDLGATYYHYPQTGALFATDDGAAGTYEFSIGLGLSEDTPLSPSVAAYYDVTLEAFTLEGAVGHSVGFGEKQGADLGLTVGLVDGDGFSYQWATASAALTHSITDDASIYIGANFTLNSDDNTLDLEKFADPVSGTAFLSATDDTLLWFGTGISTSF